MEDKEKPSCGPETLMHTDVNTGLNLDELDEAQKTFQVQLYFWLCWPFAVCQSHLALSSEYEHTHS